MNNIKDYKSKQRGKWPPWPTVNKVDHGVVHRHIGFEDDQMLTLTQLAEIIATRQIVNDPVVEQEIMAVFRRLLGDDVSDNTKWVDNMMQSNEAWRIPQLKHQLELAIQQVANINQYLLDPCAKIRAAAQQLHYRRSLDALASQKDT